MNKAALLLSLFLVACSHSQPDRSAEEAAEISRFSAAQVEAKLAETEKALDQLDERIRSAESRRDNFRLQAGTDVNKQNAVEGAEAEVASLQGKRANLLRRQRLLEARRRDLSQD